MNQVSGHVASLMTTIFEAAAVMLRDCGETTNAFLVPHSDEEYTVSLEVNRKGGDWQRNLVATIGSAGPDWDVDVQITRHV